MTVTPFFSIIIPTYNRPKLLLRALKSALAQSFTSYEVIVINDGSTANYNEVEDFINDKSNVKYIAKGNEGRSVARNIGINKALGIFICFLDDDDYYLPDHLLALNMEIVKQRNLPAIYHTYSYIINSEGEKSKHAINPKKDTVSEIEYYLTDGKMTMNNTCMHKSILKEIPFDADLYLAEDHHQRLRALLKYPVYRIDKYTTVYDKSNETSTNTLTLKGIQDYLNTFKKIFSNKEIKQQISSKKINNIFSHHCRYILSYHRNDIKWIEHFKFAYLILYYTPSLEYFLFIIRTSIWKLQKR